MKGKADLALSFINTGETAKAAQSHSFNNNPTGKLTNTESFPSENTGTTVWTRHRDQIRPMLQLCG